MTVKPLVLAVSLLLGLPAASAAQGQSPYRPIETGGGGGDGGTFIKVGLGYWQGNIFSGESLTHWNGDPFGADYGLTSLQVEYETCFDRPRLFLSGWAVGYRKDSISRLVSGHMLYGGVFRTLDLKVAGIRVGGGMEWGVPSLNFDTTTFDYRSDGAVRYNHTYPVKNADIPGTGTTKDGAFYPFLQLSLAGRTGRLLLEGGMRINFVRFQFDNYQVDPNGQITYDFSSKRVLMPMLFFDVGFKMF